MNERRSTRIKPLPLQGLTKRTPHKLPKMYRFPSNHVSGAKIITCFNIVNAMVWGQIDSIHIYIVLLPPGDTPSVPPKINSLATPLADVACGYRKKGKYLQTLVTLNCEI